MEFLQFLIRIIIYAILIIGPFVVIYLFMRIRKTSEIIEQVTSKKYTLLRILVPKQNDKTPQAAEEMFASIHGIFREGQAVQDHLSFELSARDQYIQFFVYVPVDQKDFVEGQIYAQYPTVEISEVQDYTDVDLSNWSVAAAELVLTRPDYYPIKTFVNFQVDPLAGITSVLSKIEEGEQIWVQILVRPMADVWQDKTLEYVKMIENGETVKDERVTVDKLLKGTAGFITDLAKAATTGTIPEAKDAVKPEKPQLAGPVLEGLRAAEAKTNKLGYETIIRVCAIARDEGTAIGKINGLVGAFKQYSATNLNSFVASKISTDKERILPVFQTRAFPNTGYTFNVEELASIYHLPSVSVETPSIVWAGAKKGEPPANLPIEGVVPAQDVTLYAQANYRHFNHRFGIKTPDRRYHMYAIGKTGTGKSTMLRNMIIDDIQKGRGVCVVDPHGDLIQHVLDFIPDHRIDDVVYFNPADREHPVGFNLLESVDPDLKSIVASGLMSIFTKLWANVWSARMEYILRNAVLALLEYPNATLLEIMKLLVDPTFRRKVLYHVKDPVIRDFFINEYEKYEPKFRTEAIAPIQNKVGQFLSSSTIRNIMGQEKSTIDIRGIMDTGKILLVDLSVGKIGEDNAALLGSMIITKIQLAAMGRADQAEEDRKDFYLYVDEFQNFATDSFAVILSEARKYHLNLIITHQYIAQMPEVVASAVFGNVGTIVAFRVGAGDASALAREFEPVFDANDLVNLDNYYVYLKMAIDARTATPFSAITLPPFTGKNGNRERAIQQSIERYSANRDEVEKAITDRNEANTGKVGTLVEVDGEIQYQETMKPYEPMNPLPKNAVVDGIDYWKVRDQEGKPFYVRGEDYDAYMDAKGKPSDRPVASLSSDASSDGGGGEIAQPVEQVTAPIPTPAPEPRPAAVASLVTQPTPPQQPQRAGESPNIVRHQKESENTIKKEISREDSRQSRHHSQSSRNDRHDQQHGPRREESSRQQQNKPIAQRQAQPPITQNSVQNPEPTQTVSAVTVPQQTDPIIVPMQSEPGTMVSVPSIEQLPVIAQPKEEQQSTPQQQTAIAEKYNDLNESDDSDNLVMPMQEL